MIIQSTVVMGLVSCGNKACRTHSCREGNAFLEGEKASPMEIHYLTSPQHMCISNILHIISDNSLTIQRLRLKNHFKKPVLNPKSACSSSYFFPKVCMSVHFNGIEIVLPHFAKVEYVALNSSWIIFCV